MGEDWLRLLGLAHFGQFVHNGSQGQCLLVYLRESVDEVKGLGDLARFGQIACNGCQDPGGIFAPNGFGNVERLGDLACLYKTVRNVRHVAMSYKSPMDTVG